MAALERCWFPVLWSEELNAKPRAVEVLGTKIVVFRDKEGRPSVLHDRCPHRGVELSGGKVVNGCLTCPYHGWKFNSEGKCVDVPSLIAGESIPNVSVQGYRAFEKEGVIWVSLSQEPYTEEPASWQYPEQRAFTSKLEIECDHIHVMENLVDTSHAGFLHAGLLRSEPERSVTTEVTETPTGLVIKTSGEIAKKSILYKFFLKEDTEIYHVDEFVWPNIVKLLYVSGKNQSSSQFVCTPVNEHKTLMFGRITADFSYLTPVLFPFFKSIIRRILVQDKYIMENMSKQARLYPDAKTISTKADVPSISISRAAKKLSENGSAAEKAPKSLTVSFRL